MSKSSHFVLVTSCFLASIQSLPALAQTDGPPPIPPDVRVEPLAGGQFARLVVAWGETDEECSTVLTLGNAAPVRLREGPAAGTLAVGHDALLVAYAVDEAEAPFRIRLARREGDVYRLGEPHSIARPGGGAFVPFAVVATPVPDGFVVFFQEVEENDPSAAHTYLVQVDRLGIPRGPAREVRVPWSLAAAVWNGNGYHLALIYPGASEGMRLSMVSLTADGVPEQHPDWSSRAGYIADVHLVSASGRVRAFYRGGPGGTRLLERDVTQIRNWGSEPPRASDHGALGSDSAIVLESRGGTLRPRGVSID